MGPTAEMKTPRWGLEGSALEGTRMGLGESEFMGSGGAGAHVDPAHTPGRCPHRVSLYVLLPKV